VYSYILRSSEQFYCSGLAGEMIKPFHRCHGFSGALNPAEESKENKRHVTCPSFRILPLVL